MNVIKKEYIALTSFVSSFLTLPLKISMGLILPATSLGALNLTASPSPTAPVSVSWEPCKPLEAQAYHLQMNGTLEVANALGVTSWDQSHTNHF